VAINRQGDALLLASDTQVQLVAPSRTVQAPATIFEPCTPPQAGVYVADAGVYLLTICSVEAGDGSAVVSGLGGQPSGCNIRYAVDAVQFRLIEIPLTAGELSQPNLLRNRIAYGCFGMDPLRYAIDPFAGIGSSATALDELRPRTLTDCDVPLAAIYWTATAGLVWIDMWSVRRRVARSNAAASAAAEDDALMATAEAMREQFLAQIADQTATGTSPLAAMASDSFEHLPPAGLLPIAIGSNIRAFGYAQFFSGMTFKPPVYIEGGALAALLHHSSQFPPIDVNSAEMIWLYFVRENMQVHDGGFANQPYVVFANANLPFYGESRFDRSHYDYSNYV
ncbi:MAG TPA: hypothetical protein VNN08_09100, partial [Thermoanaerobaculia bacterium]|nr:hypothetical protein [Thermoanaerobaculia bacterium]